MKLIQIPDHDTFIMASDIKIVKLYSPNSGDYGIYITTTDGVTKIYWLKVTKREPALEILNKFIEQFNNL